MLGVIGGVKPFIRLSDAGSNGLVGATRREDRDKEQQRHDDGRGDGNRRPPEVIDEIAVQKPAKPCRRAGLRGCLCGDGDAAFGPLMTRLPQVAITDPRIDGQIENVDNEIDQNEQRADEKQIGRHHGNVDEIDGVDEHQPDPGHWNTVSVMMAKATIDPSCSPATVVTGTSVLRSA